MGLILMVTLLVNLFTTSLLADDIQALSKQLLNKVSEEIDTHDEQKETKSERRLKYEQFLAL